MEMSNADMVRAEQILRLAKYYFGSDDPRVMASVMSNMKRASLAQKLCEGVSEKKRISDINARADELSKSAAEFARSEGINLDDMAENPEFLKYLASNGLSVSDAYYLADRESALKRAREELTASILSKKERISENAADSQAARRMSKKRARDLTGAEIDDSLKRVRNGEKITF